jgi:hypothetical protein
MLTLSQQILLEQFAQKVIDDLKIVLKTKPIPRKSVRYEDGKRIEKSFSAPVSASGKLADSLTYEITDTQLIIKGSDYIYFSIYGRAPTTKAGSGTVKDKIKQWIKDKGITSDISENQLAYLISRKIHREGNSIYLFSGKKNTGLLDNVITNEMVKEFNDKFTKQIEADIAEEFKKDLG